MTVVVDCSALVDLLVAPDLEAVHVAIADQVLHAPAHVDVEVVSALRGLVHPKSSEPLDGPRRVWKGRCQAEH